MSLDSNKKGSALSTFTEILLVVVTTLTIIGIFTVVTSRAEEKTAENLCKYFNEARFATKVGQGHASFSLSPRACKTIEKGDLPSKDYKDYGVGDKEKEGAKAEIRNLMARCWWMWLEGKHQNMFDQSIGAILTPSKCFVCYTFSLDKNIEIGMPDLLASLEEPYYAIDSSDRCAPLNQGGECISDCVPYGLKEIRSNKCGKDKCCIAKDARDECENKGGECLSFKEDSSYIKYSKWSCKQGSCYVKKENMESYLDYIQGTKSIDTGAGFVTHQETLSEFNKGKVYGIALVSPKRDVGFDTVGLGATTLVVGAVSSKALAIPLIGTPIAVAGAIKTYQLYQSTEKSGTDNYNFIYLSEYENIKDKCAIQTGVDEE